jgi:GT2 family glycosyltransferase
MNAPIDVSIIIVSFNTEKITDRCLSTILTSLEHSGISFEIIVVDNASTDGTRSMLAKKYPQVITILNKDNCGFGRANNQGIEKSRGEFVLLLNSDTETLDLSVEKLYRFCLTHPRSFVGGKLYNVDMSPQTSCGPFFSLPVVFAAFFLRGDRIGITRFSPRKQVRVDWVSGACIMAPKRLFADGLLFDTDIFMYMEEIDLLYRAKKKGYDVWFYPDARFIHIGGGSSTSYRKQPVLNIYRGLLYFYRKHYSAYSLTMLKYLLRLKANIAWCIGKIAGNSRIVETYEEAYRLV